MSGRVLRLAAVGLVLCALPARTRGAVRRVPPRLRVERGEDAGPLLGAVWRSARRRRRAAPSGITFGIEAANVPSVDPATATPTICRPGKGPENTDLLAGIARPRIGVPLPLGLALEASWIPPVRVNGVKANLIGLALARSVALAHGVTAGSARTPRSARFTPR